MDNTALFLARLQFGFTLTYHFWFVALTLGLSPLIALTETWYVKTGDTCYRRLAKFWGRLFLINYAVGIVTGIVNEFQFGMNWSEYSKYVGSVFGPCLAFEASTAFFVESIGIGIWAYGWNKVSPKIHLATIWLVAWSSNYSAYWILSANSFMQHPVGYMVRNERLELTDLLAIMTNPYLVQQFIHTVLAGFVTAGFFLMAVSAYYLRRKEYLTDFRKSFSLGLWCALISITLVVLSGHFYNQYLAKVQPMKMAASEALWETAAPAPFVVFAVIDEDEQRNAFQVQLPALLSILANNTVHAPVKGMQDLQGEFADRFGPGKYIPPVTVLFWSFRVMVLVGLFLTVLCVFNYWYWRKNELECRPLLLKLTIASLPLSYLATTAGWLVAELGRQPWLVYGLLLTKQGLSTAVPAASVWTSLLLYSAIYTVVALAAGYAASRVLLAGPGE